MDRHLVLQLVSPLAQLMAEKDSNQGAGMLAQELLVLFADQSQS